MSQIVQKAARFFSTKFFYETGVFLLLHFTCVVFFTSIGFLAGISLSLFSFFFASLIGIFIFFKLFLGKQEHSTEFIVILFGISLIFLGVLVSGHYIDFSTDANSFIKPAIGFLRYGWNPIYESVGEFVTDFPYIMPDNILEGEEWIDCYPKASWIYGAHLYNITGNIESGKAMAFLILISCMFISIHLFKGFELTTKQAILVSALTHINPIALKHAITFYMDGMLSNLFFLLILGLAYVTIRRRTKLAETLWIEGCIVFLCGNLKFTGLAFAAIFSFFFYLLWLWIAAKEKESKFICRMTIYYAFIVFLTVIIGGSNSYVKNIILHSSPVYPLTMDTAIVNCPTEIISYPNIVKNIVMLFTRSSNSNGVIPLQLKIPFTMNLEEFVNYSARNTLRGDFGALFSGAFLIALGVILLKMPALYRKQKEYFYLVCAYFSVLLFNGFVFDNVWHYRYHPYVYGVVVLALIFLIKQKKKKMSCFLFFVICLNLSLYSFNYMRAFRTSDEMTSLLNQAKEAEHTEWQVDYLITLNPVGIAFNMIDRDISYSFTDDISETPMFWDNCACFSYRFN